MCFSIINAVGGNVKNNVKGRANTRVRPYNVNGCGVNSNAVVMAVKAV